MNRSPEELSRELEVLKGKIQTLTLAQRRIEREAQELAQAIGELSCQPVTLSKRFFRGAETAAMSIFVSTVRIDIINGR